MVSRSRSGVSDMVRWSPEVGMTYHGLQKSVWCIMVSKSRYGVSDVVGWSPEVGMMYQIWWDDLQKLA